MHQASKHKDSWIIISDVHLGGFDDDTNLTLMHEFENLLHFATQHQFRIIINGDLFDYYMEYNGTVPEVVANGVSLLRKYTLGTSYIPVFITGNHDNWDDGYLNKNGIQVIHEEFLTTFCDLNVMIAHGDGLKNPRYNFPRRSMHLFLRNPSFVRFFKLVTTMKSGNWIMKWFSRINRIFESGNDQTTKRIDSWAVKLLKEESLDVVIAAHHHNAKLIKVSDKLYLNSGCFYRDRTLIINTNNSFKIVKWDNHTKTLIPFNSENLDS